MGTINELATKPETRPFLSVRESMALSGLSRATVTKLIFQNLVQSSKVGRKRLVNRESLLRVLHEGTGPLKPGPGQ